MKTGSFFIIKEKIVFKLDIYLLKPHNLGEHFKLPNKTFSLWRSNLERCIKESSQLIAARSYGRRVAPGKEGQAEWIPVP